MYSVCFDYIGVWCIICCLFLSDNEKVFFGLFVKIFFWIYNKFKEKFDGYEIKEYYKKVVECFYVV